MICSSGHFSPLAGRYTRHSPTLSRKVRHASIFADQRTANFGLLSGDTSLRLVFEHCGVRLLNGLNYSSVWRQTMILTAFAYLSTS